MNKANNNRPLAGPEQTVSLILHKVFGTLPTYQLREMLADAEAIERANSHHGLNAQVAANQDFGDTVAKAVKLLTAHQLAQIAGYVDITGGQS